MLHATSPGGDDGFLLMLAYVPGTLTVVGTVVLLVVLLASAGAQFHLHPEALAVDDPQPRIGAALQTGGSPSIAIGHAECRFDPPPRALCR